MTKRIGFTQDHLDQQRKADLQVLSAIDRQTQGVLRELQYIAETLETNKTIGPVENMNQKIKAAYDRIKAYMDPQFENDPDAALEAMRQQPTGVQMEKNPLIQDMGGMPLEMISSEWQEVVQGNILDKSELENLVNKKLKNRVELANKLRAKHKPKQQPKMRAARKYTPKFKDLDKTLKYIIKEMPPPPTPEPRPAPSKPRPFGM